MRYLYIIGTLIMCFLAFDVYSQNPTLVYPKNNQVINANQVKLVWDRFAGAVNYNVEVSTNSNFLPATVYNFVLDNFLEINTSLFTSYVYWKVKADNSLFSGVDSFFVFKTSSINGCQVWLNADTLVNLVAGNKVEKIYDLTSNANNATQTDDTKRPLLTEEPVFEKKTISFTGTQDLVFPLLASSNYNFFILASTGSVKNTYEAVLGSARADGARWALGLGGNGAEGAGWGGSSGNIPLLNTNHINVNEYYLLNYKKNNTGWDITANSNYIRTVLDNSTPTFLGTHLWTIGSERDLGVDYPFSGSIGSILIYTQALTSHSVTTIENYLYDYYAPPINLGENKIVCSLPLNLTAHQKPYYNSYTWQDGSTLSTYSVTTPGTYSLTVTDVFGRQSTDTITIAQDITSYSVTLGPDKSFCIGDSLYIYAGPDHLQYNWSTGATKNVIKVTAPGTYTVSVIDCFGNVSFDDIVISQNNKPVFSLGNDRTFCYDTERWLTTSLGFPVTYTWQDNSSNDSILVNHSGTYLLKVTDSNNCSYTDDVVITVDSSLFVVDLGPDLFLCEGNKISLVAGASQVASYSWLPTNDVTSHTAVGAVSRYYYVNVVNANLCTAKDSVFVTITGQAPTADFAFNTTCFGTDMQFTQFAVPPSGNSIVSYTWVFGEPSSGSNNTSSLANPLHNYSIDGSYSVTLEVQTEIGCKQAITKQAIVYPLPQADFFNYPACATANTQFKDQSNSFGFSIQQWEWSFGDVSSGANNTAFIQEPSHVFPVENTYLVSLTITTQQGCKGTIAKPVYVHASPIIDFSNSLLCLGSIVTYTNTSVMPFPQVIQNWQWSFGDGQYGTSPIELHTYTLAGNYTVSLAVSSSVGCTHLVTKSLVVTPLPTANYSYQNNCLNQTTHFKDLSLAPFSEIQTWKYEFDNSVFATTNSASFIFNSTGNKNVKLSVVNKSGCESNSTKTIVIKPSVVASFNYLPSFITPSKVISFTNLTQNAISYTWVSNNGFASSLFKPTAIFPDTGIFKVSLIAQDENGCEDAYDKNIEVLFSKIDLGIFSLQAAVSSDNYLEVSAELINYGTQPINNFKIVSSANGESSIKEAWLGDLKRGQLLPYKFNSAVRLQSVDSINAYVCVEIMNVNELDKDDDSLNDKRCAAFKTDRFILMNGYPNPVENTYTLPVIIPEDGDIDLEIYDNLGQLVFSKYSFKAAKGLSLIEIEVDFLEEGLYFYRVLFKNKVAQNKFLKF